jgi:hypothetical protein
MKFEFDKEIDILLRQAAQGKTVFAKTDVDSNHLDADEISAFAENALPEKARRNYVLHLADCDRCRKNLSGLMAINAELGSENIHAVKGDSAEIIAAPVPWYRRLFAVPNLVYAMGALIIIFAGIGVFTVLQNNDLQNSQISQVSEKQSGGKGMSSDGETATQEVFSSNQMSSNTAATMSNSASNMAMNSANLPMPSAPVMTANSNATANLRRESNQISKNALKDDKSSDELAKPNSTPTTFSAGAPPSKPNESNVEVDGVVTETEQPILSQNQSVQNQTTLNQTQIMPDSRNVQRAPMPAAKMRKQDSKAEELKKNAKENSLETTIIGGKNFNRVNNIWTDAAYRGQGTTNISRGTKEYKKLDSGLRGIVENLGGTVIIVWKDKAYRIQ